MSTYTDIQYADYDKYFPTLQERLMPLIAVDKEYRNQMEQLNEARNNAFKIGELLDKDRDKQAFTTYNSFAEDLDKRIEEMTANGLTANDYEKMLAMKSRFAKEINPIAVAYENWAKHKMEQDKIHQQNPDLISTYNPNISIDQFLKTPSVAVQSVDGNNITKAVSAMASNLRRDILDDSQMSKWKKILGAAYYERVRHNGARAEDIMDALNRAVSGEITEGDKNRAAEYLATMNNQYFGSLRMDDWNFNSEYDRLMANERANEYARRAWWDAIGDNHVDDLSNPWIKPALDRASKKATEDKPEIIDPPVVLRNLFSRKEIKETDKKRLEFIRKYGKYFSETFPGSGKYEINEEGIKELKEVTKIMAPWGDKVVERPSDFLKDMYELGFANIGSKYTGHLKNGIAYDPKSGAFMIYDQEAYDSADKLHDTLGQVASSWYNDLRTDLEEVYDANKKAAQIYNLGEGQSGKNLLDMFRSVKASSDNKSGSGMIVKEVSWDGSDWKEDGEDVDLSEASTITDVQHTNVNGKASYVATVKFNNNGKVSTKRVKFPAKTIMGAVAERIDDRYEIIEKLTKQYKESDDPTQKMQLLAAIEGQRKLINKDFANMPFVNESKNVQYVPNSN